MKRSEIITLLIMVFIVTLVFAFTKSVSKNNEREALEQSPAASVFQSDSPYTDINGNPVLLDAYLGQTVVATAWASWCNSCAKQLKLLSDVTDEQANVVVLAFNRGESAATVENYLNFYNLDTKVELILDPTDNFFNSVNGFAMPETVIFDPEGNIVHHKRGLISKEELEAALTNAP